MATIVIIISVVLLGILIVVAVVAPTKVRHSDYVNKMAHFFEGQVEPIPDNENSFRVRFNYRGYECIYEHVDLPGLQKGSASQIGYIKLKSPSKLSLSFTERSRTQIRSNAQSLEDVAKSRWGSSQGQVRLPPSLLDFHVYSNNPELANKLLNDAKIVKVFNSYKNRDSRGHPVLSIGIMEGVVALEFHAPGELKPSILELQHNVTAAEVYLREMIVLVDAIKNYDSSNSR
ncbi:MAG: hypothetical protein H6754_02575 [Candidatus Omnitrophica bacterium]|nr:hypothetical protein [Candidatus Omnitrophota bacterium]